MREHWVRELAADWPFGVPPYGQIGRYVKPLLAKYPLEQIRYHFQHFCRAARNEVAMSPEKAVYWTPAKFAQYFETWVPPTHSVVRLPYSRTVDEVDRAAGIPLPGEQT